MKNGSWILVTDGERARCFERNSTGSSLRELLDFVQLQQTLKRQARDRTGFAHALADYLNVAVAQQRCRALMLVASNSLLGELKPCLSSAAAKAMQWYVASDLTRHRGSNLQRRAGRALELQSLASF